MRREHNKVIHEHLMKEGYKKGHATKMIKAMRSHAKEHDMKPDLKKEEKKEMRSAKEGKKRMPASKMKGRKGKMIY